MHYDDDDEQCSADWLTILCPSQTALNNIIIFMNSIMMMNMMMAMRMMRMKTTGQCGA